MKHPENTLNPDPSQAHSAARFVAPSVTPSLFAARRIADRLREVRQQAIDDALSRTKMHDGLPFGNITWRAAICFANRLQAQRVVVVCRAGDRFPWCQAISRHSTMGQDYDVPDELKSPVTGNIRIQAIVTSAGGIHDCAAWTVISPQLVKVHGLLHALCRQPIDLLILDDLELPTRASLLRQHATITINPSDWRM